MSGATTYAISGVNVPAEADASRLLFHASKRTFANRGNKIGEVVIPFEDFAGLRVIMVENLPKGSCIGFGFDGVGTKVEAAERMGIYNTVAFDLFAMLCDDGVLRGGEPVAVGSVLNVKTLGNGSSHLAIMSQLAEGYEAAAREANVAVVNGEIAQMGALISGHGEFPFDWSGACLWFGNRARLYDGSQIQIGDSVVLIRESKSVRCNGLSLIRFVLKRVYGEDWHEYLFNGEKIGLVVLAPSTIYTRLMVRLNGGFDAEPICRVHGAAHITGGGIPEKFGRTLKRCDLGVDLSDLWDPPAIFHHCQEIGQVEDEEAYGTWCMGQGMAVITPDPHLVVAEAARMGFEAKDAGLIVKERGIRVRSRGFFKPGEVLPFNPH